MRGIHRGIGLEIIQCARGAPGPRPQRTPVIRLARPAVVDQPDDPLRETRAVIGLNARGVEEGVAPTVRDQLLGRRRIAARGRSASARERRRRPTRQSAAAKHHHYRGSAGAIIRRDQNQLNVYVDRWVGRVIDMSHQLPPDHRIPADLFADGLRDDPRHLRNILGNAPQHLTLKIFDDFGTALLPPHPGRRDFLPLFQRQRLRQLRKRIRQQLVIVGMIGDALVAARAGPQALDAELVHHVLTIFRGGPDPRFRLRGNNGLLSAKLRSRQKQGEKPGAGCHTVRTASILPPGNSAGWIRYCRLRRIHYS